MPRCLVSDIGVSHVTKLIPTALVLASIATLTASLPATAQSWRFEKGDPREQVEGKRASCEVYRGQPQVSMRLYGPAVDERWFCALPLVQVRLPVAHQGRAAGASERPAGVLQSPRRFRRARLSRRRQQWRLGLRRSGVAQPRLGCVTPCVRYPIQYNRRPSASCATCARSHVRRDRRGLIEPRLMPCFAGKGEAAAGLHGSLARSPDGLGHSSSCDARASAARVAARAAHADRSPSPLRGGARGGGSQHGQPSPLHSGVPMLAGACGARVPQHLPFPSVLTPPLSPPHQGPIKGRGDPDLLSCPPSPSRAAESRARTTCVNAVAQRV
jgi:hypothetical protein